MAEKWYLFESFDALFGLCRKKAAGSSARPPLFGTLYFDDQEIFFCFFFFVYISDAILTATYT